MLKRVIAWFLLIGFVLLLANILWLHFFMMQSLVIYAVIAVAFLFFGNRKK